MSLLSTLAEVMRPTPDIPTANATVQVDDVDKMPLDVPPAEEGDNSALEHGPKRIDDHKITTALRGSVAPAKALYVPLYRTLRSGKAGRDVVALQRALKRVGIRNGRATGFYGPGTVREVRNLQKRLGIGAKTGQYGPKAHAGLLRLNGYDAYGAWLMQNGPAAPAEDRNRTAAISAALYFYAIRDRVHYTQTARRMQIVREGLKNLPLPITKEIWEDCSSFYTGLLYIAGVPDPNGRNYDGFGYTGTLAQNGMRIPGPKRAAAILYGSALPYKHVTISLGNGRNISHGSEGGPYHLEDRYRGDLSHYRNYPFKEAT